MTITRKDRGELLYLPAIMERTGMPEGTVRSRYHRGDMTCLWKLGRRLVAWEKDLEAWLDEQRAATTKTRDGSAPTEGELALGWVDDALTTEETSGKPCPSGVYAHTEQEWGEPDDPRERGQDAS